MNGELILSHWVSKKAIHFTESKKEKVALDDCFQLIIIVSLDNDMHKSIVTCESAKEIREWIELLCEGTVDVRKNQRQIFVSQYEAFTTYPIEGLSEVFERFNRLINDL